jgi:hypothetical protein
MMQALGVLLVIGTAASLAIVMRWFGEAVRDRLRPAPEPPMPVDPWGVVNVALQSPQQMPDGTWQQAALVWKPCDAPMVSNNVDIHDVTDPKHNSKTCSVCQHSPTYSGVSYRTH